MDHCGECQSYKDRCLHILKEKGFKKTKVRERIAQMISDYDKPFGPKDLYDQLVDQLNVDFATIYRNFQIFANCGMLHSIGTRGKFIACNDLYCEFGSTHTIYRCKKCDKIEEKVDAFRSAIIAGVKSRFTIESTITERIGLCSTCVSA